VSELAYQSESLHTSAGIEPAEASRPRFTCYLDDCPDHLVPRRYLDTEALTQEGDCSLVVNPDLFLSRLEDLPVGIVHPALLDNFEPSEDMIWIAHPATQVLQPFWLGPKLTEVVSGLMTGGSKADDLPAGIRTVLKMAGVLVKQHPSESPALSRERTIEALATLFQEKGYAPVSGLLHPFHLAALRSYYRKLIRKGGLKLGDSQSARRYVAHNERVARLFHHQLTSAIAAIVGEPVKPSYVYVASYQSGATLEKHTDREQCEFSLTLCLDYSPEPGLHTPWPLQLHTASSIVTVFQGIGDGLVYRGRDIPHSRDTLPRGHTSTSMFFHYVPADFQGPLD